jgi:hypothetical protein
VGLVFVGEVAFEIDALMEHTPDLDPTDIKSPVQEEMPATSYPPNSRIDPVATEPEVVGSRRGRDLGTSMAARPLRVGGNVHDGPCQQGLITAATLFPERLVCLFEDRREISLGERR